MRSRPFRGSVAAVLVCAGAAAAHEARGEESCAMAPAAARCEHRSGPPAFARSERIAPACGAQPAPLVLTRPLAPETLARVFAEGESAYRARRLEEARAAFATLVEIEPTNAHAWLRLGNLHQQAGRDDDALDAYRQASLTVPSSRTEAEARGKALLNIALLNVAAASRAIDEVDAMRLGALADVRSDTARQVGAQRHRAVRAAAAEVEVLRSADGAAVEAPASEATGAWTVDRWTGRARRPPRRAEAPGRGAVVESLPDDTAVPTPRPIEVLRGGASAPRP